MGESQCEQDPDSTIPESFISIDVWVYFYIMLGKRTKPAEFAD